MNEISLSYSLQSTLDTTFYRNYKAFLIGFGRFLHNFISLFPAILNILTEIMVYMMKEAQNPWVRVDSENFTIFIEDIILLMNQNLPIIKENFFKSQNDIFIGFY